MSAVKEKVKVTPLHDRVLIEPLPVEEKTAGGILIPDTAKEKPQKGKVIAVGKGRWDEEGERRIPLDVKPGDIVLYGKYAGTEIKIDDNDYLIMRESDIYAILED